VNVTTLIDAMVRQTSILLAQLATSGGGRARGGTAPESSAGGVATAGAGGAEGTDPATTD
jgi:hypothetical protein